MSGLPGSGLLDHLPGGKLLSDLTGGLRLPGMGDGPGLPGPDFNPVSIHQIGGGDGLLGAAGTQVSNLLGDTVPGANMFDGNGHGDWNPGQMSGWQGPPGIPTDTHSPGAGTQGAVPAYGGGDDGSFQGAPHWGSTAAMPGEEMGPIGQVIEGVARDPTSLLGAVARPAAGNAVQPDMFSAAGRSPTGEPLDYAARSAGNRGVPADPRSSTDEAAPMDHQVTVQRADAVPDTKAADMEVIDWRPGGNPANQIQQRDGRQNLGDPQTGWINRNGQGQLLKLSLTVIPPVLREGEMAQSATRTALFRAVVNGQQAFIDSQGRVVGWAVRQDLPPTYVANVIQTDELLQLPDGRQVVVDAQGQLRSLATGEVLRPVGASRAAEPGMESPDPDARALAERAEARFHEVMWSTLLPSCVGLLLVVAAFLSAAAVGTMPVAVHAMFFLGAIGLAVFCVRTWKRWQRLPNGSVTKLPAITRRLRMLMALSCSAQGASAALLGIAVVLH